MKGAWLLAMLILSVSAPAGTVPVHRLARQAEARARRGEHTEALALADTALAADPAYIPLWRAKATAHLGLQEYDEAGRALAVCLLIDPHDIEANLLAMVNDIRLPATTPTAGSGRGRLLESAEYADVLSLFLGRRDVHEMLQPLLEGWRMTNIPLDGARTVLQHYVGNRLDAAEEKFSESRLPNRLAGALRDLLRRAGTGPGLWKVERGRLVREGNRLTMHAGPESDCFAWLTVSRHWSGVTATVDLTEAFPEPVHIYLRYSSPSSYLRLRIDEETISVHERIPEGGLSLVYEKLRLHLPEPELKLVLKGSSLGLSSGGELLNAGKIPVAKDIESGLVAVSFGGGSLETETEAVLGLRVASLPDTWVEMEEGAGAETVTGTLAALRTTGVILPAVDGDEGPRLAQMLLAANREGVAAYARMPRGDFDFRKIHACAAGLPERVAEGLWTGVVFELGGAGDVGRFAAAEVEVRKSGLETALVLDAATAEALANREDQPRTDWLLIRDFAGWPTKTLREFDIRHLRVLYGSPDGESYSSLMR